LSEEQLLKAIIDLGLSQVDAEVYIFLAKMGPQKGRNIADALKLYKQQLYRSLRNLQGKGLASATCEHPAQFSAISFERVIDMYIKVKTAEAQALQETRQDLMSAWRSIIKKDRRSS
jgi:sugar-specific transcriptional regulator TrmB